MTPIQQDYQSIAPSIASNQAGIEFFNTQYTLKQQLTSAYASLPFIANIANYIRDVYLPYHVNWLNGIYKTTTTTFAGSSLYFIDFPLTLPASPYPDMNTYNAGLTSCFVFTATVSSIWNPSTTIVFQTPSYNSAQLADISANPGSTFNGVATVSTVNLQQLYAENDRVVFLTQYINADPRQSQTVGGYLGPGLKYEAASMKTTASNLANQITFYTTKQRVISAFIV